MRRIRHFFITAGIIVLAALAFQAGSNLANPPTASANHGPTRSNCAASGYQKSRCQFFGFFTAQDTVYGTSSNPAQADMFDGGAQPDTYVNANDVNGFVNRVKINLFKNFSLCAGVRQPFNHPNAPYPNWHSCYLDKTDAVQAAFFVNTMLGRTGNDYTPMSAVNLDGDTEGVEWAKAHIAQWEDSVRYYATRGWVNFNKMVEYSCAIEGNKPSWNMRLYGQDVTWIYNCATGRDFLGNRIPTNYETIQFHKPGTDNYYNIVKNCANSKGDLDPITLDFNNQPYANLPATVKPNDSVTVNVSAINLGSIPTNGAVVFGAVKSQGNIDNPGINQSTPASNPYAYNGSWYWQYNPGLNPGAYIRSTFTFTVPANAQNNDKICFIPFVRRGTTDEFQHTGDEACTTVFNPNKPYLRVYGGDVVAGSGSANNNCSVDANAKITTFAKSTNGAGAGSQFAAQAPSAITEFASAMLRTAAPTPPKGLSFANGAGAGTYGGSFGGSSAICNFDYFTASAGKPSAGTPIGGNKVIPGSPDRFDQISNGQRIVLQYTGNVVINGDIIYSGSGGWTDITQIPSFYLVVDGNIYIDANTHRLDGVYVAQDVNNDGIGGRIYTCTQGATPFNTGTASSLYARCNSKLEINGAFIAQQVKFLRVQGTANNAVAGELSSPGNNIAEVFRYSPELWLVNPGFGGSSIKYDSISSLPPVL